MLTRSTEHPVSAAALLSRRQDGGAPRTAELQWAVGIVAAVVWTVLAVKVVGTIAKRRGRPIGGAIRFAVIVIVVVPPLLLLVHLGRGVLDVGRGDRAMGLATEQQTAAILARGDIDESTLAALMKDQSMMTGGKRIYTSECATCHGTFGEGGVGPNLTDSYWLHGAQLVDVYRTIREGVPTKGMLAWQRRLHPAELLAVSAYVGGLLGSEPPEPKPPEGERVERAAPKAPAAAEGDA